MGPACTVSSTDSTGPMEKTQLCIHLCAIAGVYCVCIFVLQEERLAELDCMYRQCV